MVVENVLMLQLNQNHIATDQGHADAQCNLGHMYQNGQGVKKDEKRAVKLYTLAVEQGHAHAQCNLAYMYRNGIGVLFHAHHQQHLIEVLLR